MTGWCPYKEGNLSEIECHFDGYCKECPHYRNKNKSKKKVNKNLTVSMLGEWISDEDGNIHCSVCGRPGVGESFCEHCGADMRGEKNE